MTVKWGIIGCGSVAEYKGGPALYGADDAELVAVMRRTEHLAADFAERHGAQRYYDSVDEILGDDEIDAVYVATPPHVHAEQTIRAARVGKHVLCEKPMAMNVAECREMIAACRDNGVQLMVAYYRRFWPVAQKMKELIVDGAVGEPTLARAHCANLWHPPENGSTPWRIRPEIAGGGYLWDIGAHRIDLLVHMMGEVETVCGRVEAVHFDIPVDDASSLVMKFADGAQGTATFSWTVGANIDELEVAGPEGRLMATDLGTGDIRLTRGDETETFHLPPPEPTHLHLVQHFVDCITSGRDNALPGEEGMITTAVIEAAEQSSETGRSIAIQSLL